MTQDNAEYRRNARLKFLRDQRLLHASKMQQLPDDHKLKARYAERIAEIDLELAAK